MIWLSLALAMQMVPQEVRAVEPTGTRLVVSGTGVDEASLRRLQAGLDVLSVDRTSIGDEIWTLPDNRVLDAFRALQASRAVEAVDYAGDDYRTLLLDVAETFLNDVERPQFEAIKGWPGLQEVRLQRTRQDGLSGDVLKQGFGRADGLAIDGAFLLDLPGRNRLVAAGLVADPGSRRALWRGSLASEVAGAAGVNGDAVLSTDEDRIEGSVVVGDDLFIITPIGDRGLQAVARFKTADLPADHADGDFGGAVEGNGATFVEPPATGAGEPAPVISVGVVWTSAAEAEARSYGGHIGDVIDRTIFEANFGLERSGATFRLRLADSRAINGAESPDYRSDALALANTSDGRWDDVHAWRDQTRSDVVILIRNSSKDHCGEAVAINAGESQAFAVTSYFCTIATHSLSHELGHLLGARHIGDNSTTTTPAYARGFINGSEWRTIMVEKDRCPRCGRINHWANPNVRYRGVATGIHDQNHDLRVMNANAARVAAYR